MNGKELLISAINKVIFNRDVFPAHIGADMLKELFVTAKGQDFCHIAAVAAENVADNPIKPYFEKEKLLAIYRREQLDFAQQEICDLLNRNSVEFMVLKGGIIKDFYPEGFMRTSSDIDILVKPADAERAFGILSDAGYEYKEKSLNDYHFYAKNGTHIELQFRFEVGNDESNRVLEKAWESAIPFEKGLRMSDEFLVFYNLAHAYYHFTCGGCGVKPFVDHIIMENALNYDKNAFAVLVKEGGLEAFYNGFTALCGVWFGEGTHTELTKQMESYIFSGGVYGNDKNLGKAQGQKTGRGKYFFRRIFKPKKELAAQYPRLEKHPILLPFYQVRRWFNLFGKAKRKTAKAEMDGIFNSAELKDMFKQLGI